MRGSELRYVDDDDVFLDILRKYTIMYLFYSVEHYVYLRWHLFWYLSENITNKIIFDVDTLTCAKRIDLLVQSIKFHV